MEPTPEHARLIRKLESIGELSEAEKRAIGELPLDVQTRRTNVDVVREGDVLGHCCLVLDGVTCRYKLLGEGQRQIMSFQFAGDIPDLQSLQLPVMDHSIGTLTPVRVAFIPHDSVRALMEAQPGVAGLLWRATLIDAAIFREWLVGIGRRSAHARIAHLLCELFFQMRAVGLVDLTSMVLPITQAELGDSLGLSSVHVNRVLQDLRRDGLIKSQGQMLTIADWEGLEKAGEFDPAYLHITKLAA